MPALRDAGPASPVEAAGRRRERRPSARPPVAGNSAFLSPEDVRGLTGAGTREGATRCLRANGIPFLVRADQWPTTTWEALHRALSGGAGGTRGSDDDGFDLGALQP